MLTALIFAAMLSGAPLEAPPAAAAPAPAAQPATQPADTPAVIPDASSLSEDALSGEAVSLARRDEDPKAGPGELAAGAPANLPLDQSRIENYAPPKPETPVMPSLGGFGFAAALAR